MQYLLTLNNGSDLFQIKLESEHYIYLDYPMTLTEMIKKYPSAVWLESFTKFLSTTINDVLGVEHIVLPTCTLIDIIPFDNIVEAKV